MSDKTLKHLFYEHFPLDITAKMHKELVRYMLSFELIPSNIEGLNTHLLAVTKMSFTDREYHGLFDICGVSISDVKDIIAQYEAIKPHWNILSDPYNQFAIYVCHRVLQSQKLNKKQKHEASTAVLKMLHYKLFTSIINSKLKHGAKESVMQYTIDKLSGKFMIKNSKTNTWKLVMEAKVEDILFTGTRHPNTVLHYSPDQLVLDLITDIKSRMNRQVFNIIFKYLRNNELGKGINSTSIAEGDGDDKSIKAVASSLDNMISGTSNSVTNPNEFIDPTLVKIATHYSRGLKPEDITVLLNVFSIIANDQHETDQHETVKGSGKNTIIIGYIPLIKEIIRVTYRACMLDKSVDLKSKSAIVEKTGAIFRNSRVDDQNLLIVKNSVNVFVNTHSSSKRTATNTSLKIAFIIYVILLSFKHM